MNDVDDDDDDEYVNINSSSINIFILLLLLLSHFQSLLPLFVWNGTNLQSSNHYYNQFDIQSDTKLGW